MTATTGAAEGAAHTMVTTRLGKLTVVLEEGAPDWAVLSAALACARPDQRAATHCASSSHVTG
jgi:hypothetical protein